MLISTYRVNVFPPFPKFLHRMKMAMLFSIKQETPRTTCTASLIEGNKFEVFDSFVVGTNDSGTEELLAMVGIGMLGNVVGESIGEVSQEENQDVCSRSVIPIHFNSFFFFCKQQMDH